MNVKLRRSVRFAVEILIAAVVSVGVAAQASSLDAHKREQLAMAIASYQERASAPAVSVYVDQRGHMLYRANVGITDLESHEAAGPHSVYAIGSITKSFTADAILTLVAAGRLHLRETVGALLPDYSGPGRKATVEQLLLHTSGIPNYVNEIPGVRARLRGCELTRSEMLSTFEGLPLEFRPGSRFSYSNSGYYLLGLIIERVSGESYYKFLRNDVLKPMGITRVWSGDYREIVPDRVHGYEVGAHGLENATPWYYLVPFSAGSLLTTAEELARYRRAMFKSPAVPAEVRRLMMTEVPLSGGQSSGYTLGGMIRSQFSGLTKFAHSGEIWGFSSTNAYYPQRDTTIVVLTNSSGTLLNAVSLERTIARIVFGLPMPVVDRGTLSARRLAMYSGTYSMTYKRVGPPLLSFVASNGALYFAFGAVTNPAHMTRLSRIGKDRFALADDLETQFVFRRATPGGPANEVMMEALNSSFPATRSP